jgi:hypothetical protein
MFRLSSIAEKISIAWEFAQARKWAREHSQDVEDKDRPTIGEMVAARSAEIGHAG